MAALAELELSKLLLSNECDDSPMIRIVEPGLPKRHITKMLHICLPCYAIIWLGFMPMVPPLLSPGPSGSPPLLLTTSLDVFAAQVDKIYLVDEVCDDLLPLGVSSNTGLQV